MEETDGQLLRFLLCYPAGRLQDPCLDDNELAGYLAGRLTTPERERAELHLLLCLDCRVLLQDLAEEETEGCPVHGTAAALLAGLLDESAAQGYQAHLAACTDCQAEFAYLRAHPEVEHSVAALLQSLPDLRSVQAARSVLAVLAALRLRRVALSRRSAAHLTRARELSLGQFSVRAGGTLSWEGFEEGEDTYVVALLDEEKEIWNLRAHEPRCRLPELPLEEGRDYRLRIQGLRRGQPAGEAREGVVGWLSASCLHEMARGEALTARMQEPERSLARSVLLETLGLYSEAVDLCRQLAERQPRNPVPWVMLCELFQRMGLPGRAVEAVERSNRLLGAGPDPA